MGLTTIISWLSLAVVACLGNYLCFLLCFCVFSMLARLRVGFLATKGF